MGWISCSVTRRCNGTNYSVTSLVPSPGSEPILSHAKRLGDALVAHLRSIGATLGHCHVPGREPHSGVFLTKVIFIVGTVHVHF